MVYSAAAPPGDVGDARAAVVEQGVADVLAGVPQALEEQVVVPVGLTLRGAAVTDTGEDGQAKRVGLGCFMVNLPWEDGSGRKAHLRTPGR
jgi:hypothetical protein